MFVISIFNVLVTSKFNVLFTHGFKSIKNQLVFIQNPKHQLVRWNDPLSHNIMQQQQHSFYKRMIKVILVVKLLPAMVFQYHIIMLLKSLIKTIYCYKETHVSFDLAA